jgi:hypothetical protein
MSGAAPGTAAPPHVAVVSRKESLRPLPMVAGNSCSTCDGSGLGDLLGIAGFAMYFLADHLVGDVV